MWSTRPKQASSATMAIVYITLGALMDVWSVVYYVYLRRQGTDDNTILWVYGFFFTGIVLMVIGFGLGAIGRSAKQAEVANAPPVTMTTAPAPVPVASPAQPAATIEPAAPVAPAPASSAPSVATTNNRQ